MLNDKNFGGTKQLLQCVALTMCVFSMTGCRSISSWNPFEKNEHLDPEYELARKQLNNPEKLFMAYGRWKADVGQTTEARKSFNNVLQSQPNNVEVMLEMAFNEHKAGRSSAAEQQFQLALQRFGNDPKVHHEYGRYLKQNNRLPDAIRHLGNAVAKAPSNAVYRFDFGEALARSGQIDSAISHFSQTVGEAEAYYNAGYILHQQGKTIQAAKYLALALKSRPDLPQAKQLLAEIRTGTPPVSTIVADASHRAVESIGNQEIVTDGEVIGFPGDSAIQQVSGTESDLTPAQLEQLKNQVDLKELESLGFE